jgi:hypothetical protein
MHLHLHLHLHPTNQPNHASAVPEECLLVTRHAAVQANSKNKDKAVAYWLAFIAVIVRRR